MSEDEAKAKIRITLLEGKSLSIDSEESTYEYIRPKQGGWEYTRHYVYDEFDVEEDIEFYPADRLDDLIEAIEYPTCVDWEKVD